MIADDAWRPNPRQSELLACADFEVLYGGAAGGGKSDALLIDCLGLNNPDGASILNPRYSAVIFRKTYGELAEFEKRSLVWYVRIVPGAKFNASDMLWRFPSGAQVRFAYCARYGDALAHQGREYQWIGWDELTHWPDADSYEFLLTRLRSTDAAIPCYVRATTNPGGVGHQWVRDRWAIEDSGDATRFQDGQGRWRRFIPARLSDNPFLGDDYRKTLEGRSEMMRRALLDGRWDVLEIPGAIYRDQLEKARIEGRIGRVAHDPVLPVHTFWDLGVGDSTCIWFVQQVRDEVRVIDYYEASGEGLPHYAQVLQARGYTYGRHWAPHDIQVRELGSGRSRVEVAASLGIRFDVTPNIGIDDGIHALRMLFGRLWFDAERCKVGIEALANYRWEYNEKMGEFKPRPVHDWSSHAADAARYMAVALREELPKAKPVDYSGGWMG
jgi:hypothetical protein